MVRQLMRRRRSILRIGQRSDQVQAMQFVDLTGGEHV